jgi:hypothetical protein
MTAPERYGNRKVSKMYAQINTLRQAIAGEGTPAIQAAWDAVEEHIDFAYSPRADVAEAAVAAAVQAERAKTAAIIAALNEWLESWESDLDMEAVAQIHSVVAIDHPPAIRAGGA